jgi:hypothetical protein
MLDERNQDQEQFDMFLEAVISSFTSSAIIPIIPMVGAEYRAARLCQYLRISNSNP